MSDVFVMLTPTIKAEGTRLPTEVLNVLIEMRIERGFQVPSRVSLRFLDPNYELVSSLGWVKLGGKIDVEFQGKPLVSAEVTGISVEELPGEQPELIVIAHDFSHRMARGSKVTTYQKMTYSDMVTQVARKNGLTPSVDATSETFDYTLQVDSDLGFVTELANRLGYDWWVDAEKNFNFKKPKAGPTVKLTRNDLRSFSVKATGHRSDSYKVVGWDKTQQAAATGTKQFSAAELRPESPIASKVSSTPFGTAELLSADMGVETMEEATALATALQTKGAGGSVTAKGVAYGNADIRLGGKVDVDGFGPLSGKYYVTEVEHVYNPHGMTTRFTAGDRNPTSLVDVLTGPRGGANTSILQSNLVVGVVTSLNDPDKKNRIRVKFPGLSDKDESAWARIVALGGGEQRGMVFIPEVEDEVLVGFENGDVRQPVVLGGLFSSGDTPTWDVVNGKVSTRRINSRLGHYMELGDGEQPTGQHILLMLDGEKHKLRLGADRFDIEMPQGKPALIKIGNTKIEVADNGDMTFEAPNIFLKAKLNVTIEANAIGIKGKSQTNIEATREVAISAAQVGIEAKALATIKGNAGVQIN
jgi:phage protein D/phage baseplate assembly protein gpV